MATEIGEEDVSFADRPDIGSALQVLYGTCRRAETSLQAASEHVQNRGLKYLLKRFADKHRLYADELSELAQSMGVSLTDPRLILTSLRRGWNAIRIAMIVGRADRHDAAVSLTVSPERNLLEQYECVLQGPFPEPAQNIIRAQSAGVREVFEWIQRLAASDRWTVRLYDEPEKAVRAVETLAASGFAESDIELTPLHEIVPYEPYQAEQRTRFTVDAALVGGLIGAIVGAFAGALTGYAVPVFVPAVPNGTTTLWMSTVMWGVIGTIVGASFGSFFGLLLGHGVSEDDAEVVDMTSESSAFVVSVRTNAENVSTASEILHIRHEREVDPVPA